jgi:UDP-N-acetylmuramate dehydrogenase
LGGASNTLISDGNFPGLIIAIKGMPTEKDFVTVEIENDYFIIEADAGWPLFFLAQSAGNNALSGMEWAVGIPGTVGGAMNGNAGAYGVAMGDAVKEVDVIKIIGDKSEEKKFSKADCEFGYRASIFKKDASLLILSAKIKLKRGDAEKIKEQMKDHLSARLAKHPKGFSAGSVFKNYSGVVNGGVIKKYPELEQFVEKGMIPAAFLIDSCGLKGKSIGRATISEEHANFIVNNGSASFMDVVSLIKLIKEEVEKKYKIKLEEEIKYLNLQ